MTTRDSGRKSLAARLSAQGDVTRELEAEISALKPADRHEVVLELCKTRSEASRTAGAPAAVKALSILLGDDYVRGLKPEVAAKRLAVFLRAMRNVAGADGETALLLNLMDRASAPADNGSRGRVDPDIIVASTRLERPSTRAVAGLLSDSRPLTFDWLELWVRVAMISASPEQLPLEDVETISSTIDKCLEERGPASNVVPVEIHVLRRALAYARTGRTSSKAMGRTNDADVVAPPSTSLGHELPPPALAPKSNPRGQRDVLEILDELTNAVKQERDAVATQSATSKEKFAESGSVLAQMQVALDLERKEKEKISGDAEQLRSELERIRNRLGEAKRSEEGARAALGEARQAAERLEARLSETETLVNAANASAERMAQKKLREECAVPLRELGQYVSMAVGSSNFDPARLGRSYERFVRIFQRIAAAEAPAVTPPDGVAEGDGGTT